MADQSSGLLVKVVRIIAGVILGGVMGVGIAAFMLVVFPRALFPTSSEGMAAALFAFLAVLAYAVGGITVGVLAALSSDRGGLAVLGMGTGIGLIGAFAVIELFPRAIEALSPAPDGATIFNRCLLTIVLSVACLVTGAILGKVKGRRRDTRVD
jgi:hypothetical protein